MVPDSLKCSIAEAGLNPGKVEELLARARREVDAGLLSAAQVALARNGRLAMLATFGDASQESLFCVFSATKAVTSAAAWILIEEGRLHEGEVVADIIPEFASNGKDVIRVGQLLTHTAGLPAAPFRPLDWNDPARRRERYAQWKLNWTPGSRFEYHPSSSMWVIAELIEHRAGQSFQSFIRERIAEPLGLEDLHVGLPDTPKRRADL
ncbi:MAG: serine hydrolase, partial [Gammaproteobacteria bacterium]|nr:serine hydrolase [Gammaproteobacteria bacterium]